MTPLIIESVLNHDLDCINQWAKKWLVEFNPSKTEVMFFSLSKSQNRPNLTFAETHLSFVKDHKHLGITLSEDGSWHKHIDNITKSASQILGSMRMLKYKLKRETLNQIYVSYLRPLLEYASIVWDNCAKYEKELLDKIQLDAARIVTGLTRSTKITLLLKEIGWVSLDDRRKIQKLVFVYKHNKGALPQYLNDIFPATTDNIPYLLRNRGDYATIARRLAIYSNSTMPSSLKLWNDLDIDTRSLPTLSSFKSAVKRQCNPPIVPSYFQVGERKQQILHARLRNHCSDLNSDLHLNHLRDNPKCACNSPVEDVDHFFFKCPLFSEQRIVLFTNTRPYHTLNANKLLNGIPELTDNQNNVLFLEVQRYIKTSNRFI